MRLKSTDILLRLGCHIFLAILLSQAANKFFVVDLDYELEHGFYARIFAFHGDAPDQYRILPLLPLKWICEWLPFNHAVLIYNLIFGFFALELQWRLASSKSIHWRWGLSFGLAVLYIFFQYTGWRPDTLGLLVLCQVGVLCLRDIRDRSLRFLAWGAVVIALSFSRAEVALIYALFGTFHQLPSYGLWIPIPIATQLLLKWVIFPRAGYYTDVVMLKDNLSLFYLLRNPATFLLIAALIAFWRPISEFVKATFRKNLYFYLLVIGYLCLVMVIGRVNEYRLYLPFIPLLLLITHARKPGSGTFQAGHL